MMIHVLRAAAVWAVMPAALTTAVPAGAQAPRFVDRSDQVAMAHAYEGPWEHFVGGGVAVMDCNGDAFPDFLAAGGVNRARLFINTTGEAGAPLAFDALGMIPRTTGVTGAYPLDIDGDGHLDLAILRVGANALWRGMGGCRFEDASKDWGFDGGEAWTTAFSATWEGENARPTLAFGNYVDRAAPEGPFGACAPGKLHRPTAAGYWRPIALDPGFCALSMLFSDWEGRGVQDLRVSNDRHYHMDKGAEQMWRMPEVRALTEADGWGKVVIFGMGIASQDITGDGRPEVFLTSMGDQLMQIAVDGGYAAAPFDMGTYAQRPYTGGDGNVSTGWHSQFGDVDNDGRADLFITKGNVDEMPEGAMKDPNNLLIQGPDGSFTEMGDKAGVASFARGRGGALADLNLDGRLDMIVINRRAPLEIYENQSVMRGGWLQLQPRQDGPNANAVGAWIDVRTADGRTQTQEITVGGGHASGIAGPLHIGLGLHPTARLRVRWPDGATSPWRRVSANQRLNLSRDGSDIAIAPKPTPGFAR